MSAVTLKTITPTIVTPTIAVPNIAVPNIAVPNIAVPNIAVPNTAIEPVVRPIAVRHRPTLRQVLAHRWELIAVLALLATSAAYALWTLSHLA